MLYVDVMGSARHDALTVNKMISALNTDGEYLGNPHSTHAPGRSTGLLVQDARHQILQFFGATEEYDVIFTANTTQALKMVGEYFPWSTNVKHSVYAVTQEAHNSLLGIRSYALQKDGLYVTFPTSLLLTDNIETQISTWVHHNIPSTTQMLLFAFPAECNFSGRRVDIRPQAIQRIRQLLLSYLGHRARVCILIDGAARAGKDDIQLDGSTADFFTVSFYKFLPYHAGVGALLVRKGAGYSFLEGKQYFAGGTVRFSLAQKPRHELRTDHKPSAYEDGTLNFTGIVNVRYLLSQYKCSTEAAVLASAFHNALKAQLRDRVQIYGWNEGELQGPTVTFNVFDVNKFPIGYSTVEQLALSSNIQLRVGCFCNPGACAYFLNLTEE
eukprot:PhF_6_TR21201/c0_g2_i2/m.30604/K15631/ABA3; molybdenum cofactor sulfurtransferase